MKLYFILSAPPIYPYGTLHLDFTVLTHHRANLWSYLVVLPYFTYNKIWHVKKAKLHTNWRLSRLLLAQTLPTSSIITTMSVFSNQNRVWWGVLNLVYSWHIIGHSFHNIYTYIYNIVYKNNHLDKQITFHPNLAKNNLIKYVGEIYCVNWQHSKYSLICFLYTDAYR